MLTSANLPVTRPPTRSRVTRRPVVITGRIVESQATPPAPGRPRALRLIHVVAAMGVVALFGFAVLWLVTR